MKKVFKIKLLHHFLAVLGLVSILLSYFFTNNANSTSIKNNSIDIPIKKPPNLFNIEESPDTIFNLTQKVGAMPVINIKKTKLKKDENLGTALKRINFKNYHISKIINTISKLKTGSKILSSLPVGMVIHYSIPSDIT